MRRFLKIFISASLIYALLEIKFYGVFEKDWLPYLLKVLMVSVLFGLVIASFAALLTHFIKFKWYTFVLITVLISLAGLFTGYAIVYVFFRTLNGPERNFTSDLPDKPVEFAGSFLNGKSGRTINLKTEKGYFYEVHCDLTQVCVGTKLDAIPMGPKDEFEPCAHGDGLAFIETIMPAGIITDTRMIDFSGNGDINRTYYVLLGNGNIWTWGYYFSTVDSAVNVLDVFMFGAVGFIAAFLSSFALLIKRGGQRSW